MVAAKIGKSASAKSPPIAPDEREIIGMIGPVFRRSKPEIVMEPGRNGRGIGRTLFASHGSADPGMHFLDCANGPGLDQFNHATVIVERMDLSAHLRDTFVLLCQLR